MARNAGQSSLMGFVGAPKVIIEKDEKMENIKNQLSQMDIDSMSPRDALDAFIRFRNHWRTTNERAKIESSN